MLSVAFVPIEEVRLIVRGWYRLAEYLISEKWRGDRVRAYAIESDDGRYCVYSAVNFRSLAQSAQTILDEIVENPGGSGQMSLQQLFGPSDAWTALVIGDGEPMAPAIVVQDGQRKGVWMRLERSERWEQQQTQQQQQQQYPDDRPTRRGLGDRYLRWERPQQQQQRPQADYYEDRVDRHPVEPRWSDEQVASRIRRFERFLSENGRRGKPTPDSEETSQTSPRDTLYRTPHLDLSGEGTLAPGERFEVTVYADREAARPDENVEQAIAIDAPLDQQEFTLNVALSVSSQFQVKSAVVQPIVLRRDKDVSTKAVFQLETVREILTPVAGVIVAMFDYRGRSCGRVSRGVVINAPTATPPPQNLAPPVEKRAGLSVDLTAQPPDLMVRIVDPNRDSQTFDCYVRSPLLPAYADGVQKTWQLPSKAEAFVKGYFEEFTKEASNEERLSGLRGAGRGLFEAAPPHFIEAFWAIIDAGLPLKSIYVVSEEPFVPWELMMPRRRRSDGQLDIHPPLGVSYSVGRWVTRSGFSPPQTSPMSDSYLFSPEYVRDVADSFGPARLKHAREEAEFVRANFKGRPISPAVFLVLKAAMKTGCAALLHFVCHGAESTAVSQQIYLEDDHLFSATQLSGFEEFEAAANARKPFVFLNACEVGRLQPALVGVGGFAQTFIGLGASAVIAPLWSVKDEVAYEVARRFYEAVLADPQRPFADILRTIRADAYAGVNEGEDTYAAYCFYGDPLACRASASGGL